MNYCKSRFLISIFAVFLGIVSNSIAQGPFMPTAQNILFDESGKPAKPLLTLLTLTNTAHDGSWNSIRDETQKWLRKPGSERWDMAEEEVKNPEQLWQALQALDCIDEIKPSATQYDYAIILGATVSRVRTRLAHLFDLIAQGLQVSHIVLLGSERPLDPQQEPAALLLNTADYRYADPEWTLQGELPKTEYEMMRFVFEQSVLPAGCKNVTFTFINTPMQLTANGGTKRATTVDTIIDWLSQKPKPGTCLFISNQPYVGYQDAAIRSVLPHTFAAETIGQAASKHEKIAVIKDTIGRWIWQSVKNMQLP